MDLQSRKIAFVQEFLKLQNEELISYLETTLSIGKKLYSSKEISPISFEEFFKRIEISMEDSKNDRLIEAEDLIEEIKKWS